jgi:hypothetical protein
VRKSVLDETGIRLQEGMHASYFRGTTRGKNAIRPCERRFDGVGPVVSKAALSNDLPNSGLAIDFLPTVVNSATAPCLCRFEQAIM